MDPINLVPLIEQLDDNIDDLEEALDPLLKGALSKTAGKLPLLEKAHLYVLVTYAIESILFSYLRLNGVHAKEHPVFRELIRVKQYFQKIKAAESAGNAPSTKLDKVAANRFIKHALAANEKYTANAGQQHGVKSLPAHTYFEELSQSPNVNKENVAAPRDELTDGMESDNPGSVNSRARSDNAGAEVSLERAATLPKRKRSKRGKKKKLQSRSDIPEAIPETNVAKEGQQQERKKRKARHKKQT